MSISTVPLPLPPSADPAKFSDFGRQVIGVDPGHLSPSEFVEIQHLLYKVQKYEI
jgi:xanthine dioxygenase